MKIYTTILVISLSLVLTACASTNSNLDELDRMELEDQMMQSGQTFQQKQLSGEICHNPSY
jgi:starvation-inducible outer membrane lipoprotein